MNGELAEGVVPGLLRELYVGRHTGSLRFARGDERLGLRFDHGHIVNAQTNVVEQRLGEILVRRGLLTEADLARASAVVKKEGRRLGEILVELGLMDESGLEDAVALHVHEMLAKVFTWNEGTYAFEEEAEKQSGELTLKLSTGELILEAVRAIRDPDVVRYALGDIDGVLALSSDPLLRFQKLTLSPGDGFVLSRVDGLTSAREIQQMIPQPPEETQKSLLGLLSTGIVEYAPERHRSRAIAAEPPTLAHPPTAPPPPAPPAPTAATPAPAETAAPEPPPAAPPPPPTPPPVAPAPAAAPPSPPPTAPPSPPPPPPPPPTAAAAPPSPPTDDEKSAERRREIIEAWEGLKTRNHFEVLGLARSAKEAEVKEAYFRLAKRFHPDVHHGTSLGDLRDQLEAVFIRLGQAYEVLRDSRKRGDYEERLGRPRPVAVAAEPSAVVPEPPAALDPEERQRRAEDSIRRAEKLYEQAEREDDQKLGKYGDAIHLLEPAVEAVEGKMRLRGRLALARCYLKSPRSVKLAERVLLQATLDEPQSADAWALLGGIYRDRGLRARAVSMYRRVVELKPDHEEATRYLAANGGPEPPPSEEGGGLLKKLFRKP